MRDEIETLVAAAADRAERLVAATRMAVAATLALVFLAGVLGTGPSGDAVLHRQHLLALATVAGYFALGLVAWLASKVATIGRFTAFLLATGDVLFILASLFLGLVNTGMPPDFAAALPVVWLVPLVLAFGALRYDPALQLYAAGSFLAGTILVGQLAGPWQGSGAPSPPAELSLFFAWPPNLMRALMLALAGIVLAIAARRTRQLLEQAVREARGRANLTRYLPPQVASMLATGDLAELRRGRRQRAAILFLDIRDFTSRAEAMAPEDLSRFLTAFRRRVTAVVHGHGGTIDKFVGDGALLVFGLPEPAADDAGRALACARDLRDAIARWSDELEAEGAAPVRIGIGGHVGEVFVGAVGDEQRLEYAVLGDAVNVAQRLQERCRDGGRGLVVSAALLEAAHEDETGWTPLPEVALRGRRQPLRCLAR